MARWYYKTLRISSRELMEKLKEVLPSIQEAILASVIRSKKEIAIDELIVETNHLIQDEISSKYLTKELIEGVDLSTLNIPEELVSEKCSMWEAGGMIKRISGGKGYERISPKTIFGIYIMKKDVAEEAYKTGNMQLLSAYAVDIDRYEDALRSLADGNMDDKTVSTISEIAQLKYAVEEINLENKSIDIKVGRTIDDLPKRLELNEYEESLYNAIIDRAKELQLENIKHIKERFHDQPELMEYKLRLASAPMWRILDDLIFYNGIKAEYGAERIIEKLVERNDLSPLNKAVMLQLSLVSLEKYYGKKGIAKCDSYDRLSRNIDRALKIYIQLKIGEKVMMTYSGKISYQLRLCGVKSYELLEEQWNYAKQWGERVRNESIISQMIFIGTMITFIQISNATVYNENITDGAFKLVMKCIDRVENQKKLFGKLLRLDLNYCYDLIKSNTDIIVTLERYVEEINEIMDEDENSIRNLIRITNGVSYVSNLLWMNHDKISRSDKLMELTNRLKENSEWNRWLAFGRLRNDKKMNTS